MRRGQRAWRRLGPRRHRRWQRERPTPWRRHPRRWASAPAFPCRWAALPPPPQPQAISVSVLRPDRAPLQANFRVRKGVARRAPLNWQMYELETTLPAPMSASAVLPRRGGCGASDGRCPSPRASAAAARAAVLPTKKSEMVTDTRLAACNEPAQPRNKTSLALDVIGG
eukprot:SM001603S02508  [mRNA]  locus=s1603:1105:1608:+ [translate_table: standard]